MSTKVRLDITAGLPFKKLIQVTLPLGRTWWNVLSDFELRMQIRETPEETGILVLNLTTFLTTTFSDANTVNVMFSMTGAETRTVIEGGYYDLIMSDVGITDARAYKLLTGTVRLSHLVTKKEGAV